MALLLATVLALAPPAAAEEVSVLPPPALGYHRRRTTLGLAGMGTLTAWSIANIGGGLAGTFTTTGPVRHFHEGNAAWNTVNLTLGIIGLVGQRKEQRNPVGLAVARDRARKAQLGFAINASLDVLYMSTGAAMWTVGREREWARIEGYGQSLVLQGAFLFAFDVVMLGMHEWLLARVDRQRTPRVALHPLVTAGPAPWMGVGLTLQPRR